MAESEEKPIWLKDHQFRDGSRSSSNRAYTFLYNIFMKDSTELHRLDQQTALQSLEKEIINRFNLTQKIACEILANVKQDVLKVRQADTSHIPKTLDEIFTTASQDPDSQKKTFSHSDEHKNGTTPIEFDRNYRMLHPKDQLIVKSIFANQKSYLAFPKTGLARTTFYSRLNKLCRKEILYVITKDNRVIHYSQKNKFDIFILNPLFFSDFFCSESLSHSSEGGSPENKFVPFFQPSNNFSLSSNEDHSDSQTSLSHSDSDTILSQTARNVSYPSEHSLHSATSEGNLPFDDKPFIQTLLLDDSFDPKIIRSHSYVLEYRIDQSPAHLDFLLSTKPFYKPIYMKNWPRPKYSFSSKMTIDFPGGSIGEIFLEFIVQFNLHQVTIFINNIFGRNPFENDIEAAYRAERLKAEIEDDFPGLRLTFLSSNRTETTGRHHAWIHSILALKCAQQNVSLRSKYWEIDQSKDTPEQEAVDKINSNQHLKNELDDFDWRADNEYYLSNAFADIQVAKQKLASQAASLADVTKDQVSINEQLITRQTKTAESLEQLQFILEEQYASNTAFDKQFVNSLTAISSQVQSSQKLFEKLLYSQEIITDNLIKLTDRTFKPKKAKSIFSKVRGIFH